MGSFLHFGILYPESRAYSLRLYSIIYAPGVVGVSFFISTFFNKDLVSTFASIEPMLVSLYALAGGVALLRTYFLTSKEKRSAIGIDIICLGILLANLPYIFSTFIPSMYFGGVYGTILYRLLFIMQPVSFALAIKRLNSFRQMDRVNAGN